MTRNLKALGLALVAALALSAVAASAASAGSHHFDGTEKDKIEVKANEAQVFRTTTSVNEGYECAAISTTGEVEAATATTVTVEPHYTNCVAFPSGAKIFVRSNGCHYKFYGVTTTGNLTQNGEHANVEVLCPAGKAIEIRATALELPCADVPEQQIKHAVRYEEVGETQIRVVPTAHGIESVTTGVCEKAGEPVIHTNGSYTGNVTVGAKNGLKLTTNVT